MSDVHLPLFDRLEEKKEPQKSAQPQKWTFDQLFETYCQFKETDGCSACFLNSIKRHLRHFIDWLRCYGFDSSTQKLSEINAAMLADYRQCLADNTKIGVVTANLYINHVRMLFSWAEDIYGLTHPRMGVLRKFRKNKSVKKDHGRKQDRSAISWQELERLFAAADVVDTALLLLGLNCGFGNTDIGTLKLCDIDLEAGTVSHPRQKTGVSRNFVLWPETVEILKTYLKEQRGQPANEKIAELVFVGKRGNPLCWEGNGPDGKFRRSDAVKNRFVRLYKKARLHRPYGRGYYSLRHSHATYIGLGSGDIREVQASLGHLTLRQQEVYRHDRDQKAKLAQERIHRQLQETLIPKIVGHRCI